MAMGDLARQDEYSPDDNWFADALAAQNAARGSFEGWRRPATDPEGPPTQWEMARRVATGAAPIPSGNAEGAMGLLLGMGRAGDTMADTAADVGRAVPAGVALGLEHGAWMGSLLSHDPSDREAVTEGFAHAREAMPWMAYDPQTAPGRYAKEIASVMGNPINWAGPGGAAVKASWNTLSGIGSETLGNMYKGTPYERAARLVGGWTPLGAEWGSRALMRAVPEGAAGALGGRLRQPQPEVPRVANSNVSQAEIVANLPGPLSANERIWQNYVRRMSPEEMLKSEPLWSTAANLSTQKGISPSEAFAEIVNDMYGRMGANKHMTPRQAKLEMARQRGVVTAVPSDDEMGALARQDRYGEQQ